MIYINMPLGFAHGWGVCGRYITRELAKLGPVRLITRPFEVASIGDALEHHELRSLVATAEDLAAFAAVQQLRVANGPLLQSIADHTLMPLQPELRGRSTIGYVFFEQNLIQPAWIENGRAFYDRVLTGSTWCTELLRQAGLENVGTIIQGIDPAIFFPRTESAGGREFLADKFVVFSGGKFELRKGQDVVIRAVKVLQDRHADVVLVNAWHNPWQSSLETMRASNLIRFNLRSGSYLEVIQQILADNGIDLRRVVTCLPQPNASMARVYANSDVGLFPNRCEGGTNLVMMEYMACGKPVVATQSTGHSDIVTEHNALVVRNQGEITLRRGGEPIARWPQPDLNDVIDKLEFAYQNREQLRVLGRRAAADLGQLTWARTAREFQTVLTT